MSRATAKRSTPPAILKAGTVMPKKRKMSEPPRPNAVSTRKQVSEARRAMLACASRGCSPTRARKMGTAAKGSTMEKSDPKQTREKDVSGLIESSALSHGVRGVSTHAPCLDVRPTATLDPRGAREKVRDRSGRYAKAPAGEVRGGKLQ